MRFWSRSACSRISTHRTFPLGSRSPSQSRAVVYTTARLCVWRSFWMGKVLDLLRLTIDKKALIVLFSAVVWS